MSLDIIIKVLGWSALINYIVLFTWFLMFVLAKDFVYNIHTRWFKITREQFNVIHYSGTLFYKLIIFVFNLVPYLVLRFCL